MIYIKDGTAKGTTDLCKTCVNASIAVMADSKKIVKCSMFETRITQRVVECNAYAERNRQSLQDMYVTAYILQRDIRTNKPAGFKSYKDHTEKEQKDLKEESWRHD